MRIALVVGCLFLVLAGGCCAAEFTEVGIRLDLQPSLWREDDGSITWSFFLGVFAKASLTEAWNVRGQFGSSLSLWMPHLAVGATWAFAPRFAVDTELMLLGGFDGPSSAQFSMGGRCLVPVGGTGHLLVSSFPLTVILAQFLDEWSLWPVFNLNLAIDGTFSLGERLALGQSLRLSLIDMPPGDASLAFRITDTLALRAHFTTHIGIRPQLQGAHE